MNDGETCSLSGYPPGIKAANSRLTALSVQHNCPGVPFVIIKNCMLRNNIRHCAQSHLSLTVGNRRFLSLKPKLGTLGLALCTIL